MLWCFVREREERGVVWTVSECDRGAVVRPLLIW